VPASRCVDHVKEARDNLCGPPLVKAATGEVVIAEIWAVANVHTRLSGVADVSAEIDGPMRWTARLAAGLEPLNPDQCCSGNPLRGPPMIRGNAGQLFRDLRTPYEHPEVIMRLSMQSLDEFKPAYANAESAFAQSKGCPVAIVANNRVLFSESPEEVAFCRALFAAQKSLCHFAKISPALMVGEIRERRHRAHGPDGDSRGLDQRPQDSPCWLRNRSARGTTGMRARVIKAAFMWTWPNCASRLWRRRPLGSCHGQIRDAI